MTISRCDIATAMLRDVIAEWTEWPSELFTITGYSWEQYRALDQKLTQSSAEIESDDEAMLSQAAIQFFGYPGMTTASVEAALGANWRQVVEAAFLSARKQ